MLQFVLTPVEKIEIDTIIFFNDELYPVCESLTFYEDEDNPDESKLKYTFYSPNDTQLHFKMGDKVLTPHPSYDASHAGSILLRNIYDTLEGIGKINL